MTKRSQKPVVAFVAALVVVDTVVAFAVAGLRPPGEANVAALPVLAGLLVAAEYLFIRFRFSGTVNALNLVEAVLAPLLFAFPPPAAMATIAVTSVAGGALRANSPIKTAFNAVQWSLAAGVGSAVLIPLAGEELGVRTGVAVLLGLAAVGVVNHTAFSVVLGISNRLAPRRLLSGLRAVMWPGWALGWAINALVGALFVFAYAAHPVSVMLFAVPLAVLHYAYRGHAGARTDRVRLAGLHRAASVIAEPLDPSEAIAPYLREVATCFEARAASLVLPGGDGRVVHLVDMRAAGAYRSWTEETGMPSLHGALLAQPGPQRVTAGGRRALSEALVAAGWRDCLSAPLIDEGRISGSLAVLDQAGFEGFEEGELAVIESLARETAATFAKGRLLATVLEERRRSSEIVTGTSDGICTMGLDGMLRSWNPAMERITGLPASEAVDTSGAFARLRPQTADGAPIHLERWAAGPDLHGEMVITALDGTPRRLSCSYSRASDDRTLVVVARDVTREGELKELRQEYGRLAREQAAQRTVVEQLQQAVMPPAPAVPGAELGVSYVASDPTAPTGGDLYDWQAMPSGEMHIAVVDVLGHGVAATKDALSVVHALRMLAAQGCPLAEMIGAADELLRAVNPELVATAMIARFDPSSGLVRLASGGHPPALHLSDRYGVRQIAAPGGVIGWPRAGSDGVGEVVLEPGDSLVLYTDGLVEARKDILEGTETLMRHADELKHLPAGTLADDLIRRSLQGGDLRDDSLALVLRRTPVSDRLSRRLEPDPAEASAVRREGRDWLAARGVDTSTISDLELVTAELLSNAVEAARGSIALRLTIDGGVASIEVEDDGRGHPDLDSFGHSPPEPAAARGRGLFIVRSISDDVSILSTFEGTVVRCLKRLVPVETRDPLRS